MPDQPLGGDEIRALLREVAEVLGDDGVRHTVTVVGGSLLAWHDLRESTVDVDTVRRIDPELAHAVEIVADRHGLASRWMNDHAAGFAPQTFDESACDVLLETSRLLVLGLPLRDVFLMKLYAGRARDHDDLVALWPRTGFATAREAVDAMCRAYPAATQDEYLESYVADIAAEATS